MIHIDVIESVLCNLGLVCFVVWEPASEPTEPGTKHLWTNATKGDGMEFSQFPDDDVFTVFACVVHSDLRCAFSFSRIL